MKLRIYMKHQRRLIILLVVSVILTIIGYIIDTDPPYPNFLHTVFEFCMLTIMIFGFLAIIYFGLNFIFGLTRRED